MNHVETTYNRLPERVRGLLHQYEWDRMTPDEQRQWLVNMLDDARGLIDHFVERIKALTKDTDHG